MPTASILSRIPITISEQSSCVSVFPTLRMTRQLPRSLCQPHEESGLSQTHKVRVKHSTKL